MRSCDVNETEVALGLSNAHSRAVRGSLEHLVDVHIPRAHKRREAGLRVARPGDAGLTDSLLALQLRFAVVSERMRGRVLTERRPRPSWVPMGGQTAHVDQSRGAVRHGAQ